MNRTWKLPVWFAVGGTIALGALWLGSPVAAVERADVVAAAQSITKDELQGLVNVLADDTFEGREAGSRGGRAAGNFLMKEFEKQGLAPLGDGGTYFQGFNSASRNILGLLEGSDPQLKQQVLVLGAHYDHVGYGRATNSFGPFGYIHNGADDNASGVAGLLEVLGAIKSLPQPPRRSILFAFWDAEEQGLLGSQHWLASPTLPLSRLAGSINLDMIGRLRDGNVQVFGSRSSNGLRRLVSEANRDTGLVVDFSWKMKADSDHWPFLARSVPTLMFHTGLHGDYHRPSDDSHTLNPDGMAKVSRLVFETALELANRDVAGTFRQAGRQETVNHQAYFESPVQPQAPRFGIPFKVEGEDPPRFVLTGVNYNSPAERGGLRAGDRLLEFRGEPIVEDRQFRLKLLAASGESVFLVERAGEEKPVEVKVTPLGPPIRVGLTWRWDDGEPGTVLVTQVVYGSAAHAAGLAVRDRIYSVNGQQFAGDDQLSQLLSTLPSPLAIEVERMGKLQTLKVEVLSEQPAGE
jgi:hypothetical protein